MDRARPDEPSAAAPVPAPAAPPRLVTPRQYLWIVGAALVAALALQFLGPVLTPFLIGAIFAYIGAPLVREAMLCAKKVFAEERAKSKA